MSKRIRRLWWKVAGAIDEAKYDIKYKLENWNECPVCDGYGQLVMDTIEWWDIKEECFFCEGKGKVSLFMLVKYWLHKKDYVG